MVFFFFFKQKTAYEMRISDWSSDVCSSDLLIPEQRAAILLAAEGLSIEEAAASLAIPAGTFKSRLWRGRLRLKRLMEHRDTPLLDRRVAEKRPMTRPRRNRNWQGVVIGRSEERRVGKECVSTGRIRWAPTNRKKNKQKKKNK